MVSPILIGSNCLLNGRPSVGGPTAGPHFFTVDGPATHLAAGVAEPNVFAIGDRGRAAGATKTIGVDTECFWIAGELALPEGVSVVCIDAVQHDVGALL